MTTLDTYRKRAKQLLRRHRDGNYSVGGKLRLLPRYRNLTDRQALDLPMPLAVAQEIVAVEAGYADWPALKAAAADAPKTPRPAPGAVAARPAVPILFVRDVAASAAFYRDQLGFAIDFLHGNPAFYGAVSRDLACLHLRLVQRPNFAALAASECGLILATIEVGNLKALFAELQARAVDMPQGPTRQAWGGITLHVRDPDGNVFSFVEYA